MARHALALATILFVAPLTTRADSLPAGEPPLQIFLEPFGEPDTGTADFDAAVAGNARLGAGDTATFDATPNNETVASATVDSVQLALFGNTARGVPFAFHPTNFFNWEGQVFKGTVAMGSVGRMMPMQAGPRLGAIGFWIFDDGNLRDSIYLVEVVDACGNELAAIVENQTPRVGGYEVEGFFGCVSTHGIVSVVVTALDTSTGNAWNDSFEIDYLTAFQLVDPKPCQPVVSEPPPDDDADDTCACECKHCKRCRSGHGNHGRRCRFGHWRKNPCLPLREAYRGGKCNQRRR